MVLIPSPVTNSHTYSDPLTPSSVTYFMDGPSRLKRYIVHIKLLYIKIFMYSTLLVYIYIYIIQCITLLYCIVIYISIGYIYNFPCRFGVRIFLLYHSACRKRRLKGGCAW